MQAPPLIDLVAVSKDFPVLSTAGSRVSVLLSLLANRPVARSTRVLDSVNLRVEAGGTWGIIGENGAGKSTLLKIIAGVTRPSEGRRALNGRVTALLELGAGFHPEYTGRENVQLAASLQGWTWQQIDRHFPAILDFADIGAQIDQPVKTYSSGMIVRLGFAIATALKPDLLITDEILAVGDEGFQKKCLHWLEEYREAGGALLLCSHSMFQIQSLCQNAIWLDHGLVRMTGDAYSVTQAYLAFHEEKARTRLAPISHAAHPSASWPTMQELWTTGNDGIERTVFAMGDDFELHGTYRSPDDRPTKLMIGIVRLDLTPVFGTFSEDADFVSTRLAEAVFGFGISFPANALLPGRYVLRGHTMDEFGLRMADTLAMEITITGQTREHGLVRLAHQWRAGTARGQSK